MEMALIENGRGVRRAFIEKFTMTHEEFMKKHRGLPPYDRDFPETVETLFIWDRLNRDKTGIREVPFAKALELLKTLSGDVLLMPEHSPCCGVFCQMAQGIDREDCVKKANAKGLAELIEYEWYETWRLSRQDEYLENVMLPDDLYVFDVSMDHALIFTHEFDEWDKEDTEDFMVCADSRWCFAYGFDADDKTPAV